MKRAKNQPWTFVTKSAKETRFFGEKLLAKYPRCDVFCLYGNLGAGKTQLVAGMGEALGIRGIKSPTYTIIREHVFGRGIFYHIDLYRLEASEAFALDFFDIFAKKKKIVAIEWAEKLENHLSKPRVDIYIKDMGGDEREFVCHCEHARSEAECVFSVIERSDRSNLKARALKSKGTCLPPACRQAGQAGMSKVKVAGSM